jgi:hypothetical protein
MPSIFHWKPKKLAASIRVKSPTLKKVAPSEGSDPIKKIDPPIEEQTLNLSPKQKSIDEVPYIDRSSSPSTANFPLNVKREEHENMHQNAHYGRQDSNQRQNTEYARQYSPQRRVSPQRPIISNGNYEQPRDYFSRQQFIAGDYTRMGRVQRNVHFNDEEEEYFDEG